MFDKPVAIIKKILLSEVVKWGKVRIGDSGDAIRGKNILPLDARDNSFIKASIPITQCHVIENNVTSTPFLWTRMLGIDGVPQNLNHRYSMASLTL